MNNNWYSTRIMYNKLVDSRSPDFDGWSIPDIIPVTIS